MHSPVRSRESGEHLPVRIPATAPNPALCSPPVGLSSQPHGYPTHQRTRPHRGEGGGRARARVSVKCWSPVRPDCRLGARWGCGRNRCLGSGPLGCIHGSDVSTGRHIAPSKRTVPSSGPRCADGQVRGLLTGTGRMQLRLCTRSQSQAGVRSCARAGLLGPWAPCTDHGPLALSCSHAGARDRDTDVFPIAAPLRPGGHCLSSRQGPVGLENEATSPIC